MYSKYVDYVVNDLNIKGYDVLYLAAFGSYNYKLEMKNSDFDVKAIVNIDNSELYKNIKTCSNIKYDFGECEVLNIYEFGERLMNFDLPCLEILFSKINYVNQFFEHEKLKDYVNEALLKNRTYLGNEILRVMEKIDKSFMKTMFDFKGKKTYNIIRLYNLFVKFNSTHKYEDSLVISDEVERNKMIRHKNGSITKNEANNDCDEYIYKMKIYLRYHTYTNSEGLKNKIMKLVLQLTEDMKKKQMINENHEEVKNRLSISNVSYYYTFERNDVEREPERNDVEREPNLESKIVEIFDVEIKKIKKFIIILYALKLLVIGCILLSIAFYLK